MKDNIIVVHLFGEVVGWLDYNIEKDSSVFEFNPDFKYINNVSPLIMNPEKSDTMTFPFSFKKNEWFQGLPPMIADSLPDNFGNDVLRSWLERNGKEDHFNIPMRLSYVGVRGLGGLEYTPVLSGVENDSTFFDLKELADLSSKIASERLPEDFNKEKLNNLFLVGTTAGGALAKAVVSINFKTKQIISSNTFVDDFTPIIIKFDKRNPDNHDVSIQSGKVEFLYYKMAKSLGINMTKCGVFKQDDFQHFFTERFDRDNNGNKIHIQTYSAMKGVSPTIDLSNEGVFQAMLDLNMNYNELEQQYKRVVFNIMSSNDDCHAKNISFIMNENGSWNLTPAYDITFPYQLNKVWKGEQCMSVNGKKKNITQDDLLILAKQFGIKNAKTIIKDTGDCMKQFSSLAEKHKLKKGYINIIDKYLIKDFDVRINKNPPSKDKGMSM